MFDVFYIGKKPGLFSHERAAGSCQEASQLSRTSHCWIITYLVDYSGFDFLWVPVPWESHYRHAWPDQHQPDSETYLLPCAGWNETKYHSSPRLIRLPNQAYWSVPQYIDRSSVDFSWHPDPSDSPYIYHFPSQHQRASGVIYAVPGATEIKMIDSPRVTALQCRDHWEIPAWIDPDSIDYTWHPDALDPPCNYHFETKWHWDRCGGPEYCVPGAQDVKYLDSFVAGTCSDRSYWYVPDWIDSTSIDYTWVPNPADPPYIYEFPVEWGWNNIGGPEYRVPGATEKKYVTEFVARTRPDPDKFEILDHIGLTDDVLRWRPNPTETPYIYVFGNQWHAPEQRSSVRYHVPGAIEIKYVKDIVARRLPTPENFVTHFPCEFDWSWEPDPGDPPYIYVFGNQWWPAETWPTVKYTVPGATELKYMDYPRAKLIVNQEYWTILTDRAFEFDYSWQPDPGDPPYRYVFGNQWHSAEVMPTVGWTHPDADTDTPVKYVDWPRATLLPDATNWTLPAGVTPDSVDFSWVPDPGEPPYIYQFATQHQKTGGPVYTVPGATETKYLESVEIKIEVETVPIVEIDHLDGHAGNIANVIKRVRYFDNYRDTLIRIAKNLLGQHEFVWVCSSVCDYTDFDFTWHPEKWQSTMLHVFASNEQKFGDTFYMHVPTFAERAEKKALLEWYAVNYVPRKSVPRRAMPVFEHTNDTHVDIVQNTNWAGPLALFTTNGVPTLAPTVPLWRSEVKTIVPLDSGSGAVIVPKSAVPSIRTQLYDYAYIDKSYKAWSKDRPIDIVYISNGEPNAERNWQRLQSMVGGRAKRVDGINGRGAAYRAAANASETAWFFAVFAKLAVDNEFDWTWLPDRMQQAKHYIFHARNLITGLEYGHMAMIAYNRRLVLENKEQGLDFTLDQPHEVVPVLSGVAEYNDDAWMTWRTAFREVLKLRHSLPDVENQYRLNRWLTSDSGVNGEWSRWGAEDAVAYYESVGGDFDQLRLSYEWSWLRNYAQSKRGLTPGQ